MVHKQGLFFLVGTKPEIEGVRFSSLQGSVGRIFFGDLHDADEVKEAGCCLCNGMYCANPAGAVLSKEEAVRWGQINKPSVLPDGFRCQEAMEWSVTLVSAKMSALASMLDADERRLHVAETRCAVEQGAVDCKTSAALEEQIERDLAEGYQTLQDMLEQLTHGAYELFTNSELSVEEGQGSVRSPQDSEALLQIRTATRAAWREADCLVAMGIKQWSEAMQAWARDQATACQRELESLWGHITTDTADGRWRAKDDADEVETLQSGLRTTRDLEHGADRVRVLRQLAGQTQVLCSHIRADRQGLERLLQRCGTAVEKELDCLRQDLQTDSLRVHEALSAAQVDGGSRSRVVRSSCDRVRAAPRPASTDRRLWKAWSLQASTLCQLGFVLGLGMHLWQRFANLTPDATQITAVGIGALHVGWWCYQAARMLGIVAMCIAVQCRRLWQLRNVVVLATAMLELCCQMLAHQWFRRMLVWVHPCPMLECLRCTACSGLVGRAFSSRCRTKHYCSKRCRQVVDTLLIRRSAAGVVAEMQRMSESTDVSASLPAAVRRVLQGMRLMRAVWRAPLAVGTAVETVEAPEPDAEDDAVVAPEPGAVEGKNSWDGRCWGWELLEQDDWFARITAVDWGPHRWSGRPADDLISEQEAFECCLQRYGTGRGVQSTLAHLREAGFDVDGSRLHRGWRELRVGARRRRKEDGWPGGNDGTD